MEKLKYNFYYIKNRNFLLDLQMVFKTAETMLIIQEAR